MPKNLVIVESPAKAKTIEKFLGSDFKVRSSYGHIRDLKKHNFSIDINNQFEPIYEIPQDKLQVVNTLKKDAQKAEMVWLASDEDREGEAISWHLYEVLGLQPEKTRRIVFHEITKTAILNAIEQPRDIDHNLVNAQQARRVLDRIVGFELSPVLWRKVKPSLSAGRVQSVAVRLIVEREREINQFVPEESYRVVGTFATHDTNGKVVLLEAELNQRFKTKEEAKAFLEQCNNASFKIADITQKPISRMPAPPFTTSTLQQEAARKLRFSVSQTMSVAQRLYESGHITYMRTDSVNLSKLCLGASKKQILETMGDEYLKLRQYQTKTKGAQEAHEAIRPTYMENATIDASANERRLYELIWKRTIASQMTDAIIEKTNIDIEIAGMKERFVATGEVIKFDGFLKVYMESTDDEADDKEHGTRLPSLQLNQTLMLNKAEAAQRFSQRPLRYTEASLVKKMEELGIGRPSTYAPTISTIQARDYVVKYDKGVEKRNITRLTLKNGHITQTTLSETYGNDKGKLTPTDIGIVVNDFLNEHFPDIMSYNFTATVENEFDKIAEGQEEWTECLQSFYDLFHPLVTKTLEERSDRKAGERILGKDPKSGRTVSVKISRFGAIAQIGMQDETEKPQFAALQKGQSISTITLEEAIRLFDLPKDLGTFEEQVITIGVGKFGPYIRHNNKFVSLPDGINPLDVTLEQAIGLIEEKRSEDLKKIMKTFAEDASLQIINGRFGPYITKDGKNYKLPRSKKADTLTYEDCLSIINEADQNETKTPKSRGRYTRKKQ